MQLSLSGVNVTAVIIARARLHEVRRQHTPRQAGATDVHNAEAELSAALDQLDHATQLHGR